MKTKAHIIIIILLAFCLLPFFTQQSAAVDQQVSLWLGDSSGIIENPYDIGMIMYSKPSFVGDVVMTIMNGTQVIVLSEPKEAEGYRWVLVQTEDRQEGWVFATGVKNLEGELPSPQMNGGNQSAYGLQLGPSAGTVLGTQYNPSDTNSGSSNYSGNTYSNNNYGYSNPGNSNYNNNYGYSNPGNSNYNNNYGYSNSSNSNYNYNNGFSGGQQVWIYETGKRYHSHHGCSGADDWAVSLEYAESIGKTPCKKCY